MKTENVITLAAAALSFLASVVATAVSIYNARFARFAKEREPTRTRGSSKRFRAWCFTTKSISPLKRSAERFQILAVRKSKSTGGMVMWR